ncbi:hypothetical protein SAMN05880501_107163 [Ureibacillus xyleni]|uniref:Lipoprotein n=1 Tax=Ureibacillus xyleni TaxID=614648 RepID=A0A285SXF8_9BACL|nr:hypothetical protein [Ureibacillus xyleni]SOC13350.1 hypothetical protein SAMN05880501_107163 [Ureibacillus xyleni]
MKYVFLYLCLTLLLLVGCSSNEKEKQEEKIEQTTTETKKEEAQDGSKNKEDISYDETKLVEAVDTAKVYPEITFQNINWFFGSPDRQPYGGIWVYTSETIPSGYDDTIDWEQNDLLLLQVNDAQYVDHELEIKALQILDDNVVKIVVSIEPDEYSTDKKAARRYASVEKGQLGGKKFLVETVEGDQIDVGTEVKTSEISK